MARKDSLSNLRAILVRRRDALRSALAGDLSLLKDLRSESPGDVIDAAYDSTQDEADASVLRRLFSKRLGRLGAQLRQELEHAVEVGKPRTIAVEKIAEGVVAV